MARIDNMPINVEVTVGGEVFKIDGIANLEDAIHTNMFKAAIEVDAPLVRKKLMTTLAGKLREMADQLEAEA